jgi:hypothetical protein
VRGRTGGVPCNMFTVSNHITQLLVPVSSQLASTCVYALSVEVWHVIDDVHVCMCRGVGRD